ncbi:mitochondrial inner membrane i-AAA protease supercomplex subunit YME1 [Echria macrotheca]|uniref:Mitochondrial inner membrane i-AAA protease supercomplex subunit YME1 n=1 Tax=Echria macrotheca TaxID=438768 RepID=A0AAJ0BMZ4_9PEZI|nr:mitochondrial inner membrane i-AAA protease supercomplex subunit YME1 [Echria macrotheca]
MAFHASGLPSVAAATADLWPSISSALLIPWSGSARIARITKSTKPASAHASSTAPSSTIDSSVPLTSAREHAVRPARPALPDFLREVDVNTVFPNLNANDRTRNSIPLNLLTNMAPRSMAMANPLLRRSLAALVSRPLGTPFTARLMSTYQARRFDTPSFRHLQYRGFGSGNTISRTVLASREAAANRNPNSATAQNGFYQALLKANMPAIVVERYQSGRFATNEATDDAYRKALAMMSGTPAAVQNSVGEAGGLSSTQAQAIGQAIAAQKAGGNMAASVKGVGGKDGPIHVVVDETFGASFFRWIKFILWFGFISYASLIVITMAVEATSTLRQPGGKRTDFNEVKPENQKARFSDVQGCDEAKEEVQDIVDFLRNPDRYSSLGGKMPKGVLLVGPPGTGKTLLARAVAGEAGVPFFFVSGSEFDEIYVGVGAKRVRELFAAAKAKSPSIIFIDELDAIGGRRHSRDASYVRQTLNQLLTEMDGFEQNSSVIIMAATNFPESLDEALTRPGRFDRHVAVSLPDVRGRIAILAHHAKKIKAAADVNLQAIAARTSGLSGADLENIVNAAAIHASKLKAAAVTQKHLEWAKDKIIMGAEKRSMVISPKEKEMTAYHEAGHALVAYFSSSASTELYKVTILPRGNSLGHTAFLPEMDKYSMTHKDHLDMIDRAMGGKAAEEIVYGTDQVTSGVYGDLDSATKIAWQMVGQLGMSEKLGPVEYLRRYNQLSSETRAMVEAEVKKVLDDSYSRARTLLMSKRKELDLLAKALVEYETLDKPEVEKILRGEKLKDRIPVPPGPMAVPKPTGPVGQTGIPLPPLPGNGSPPPPPAAARDDSGGEGR